MNYSLQTMKLTKFVQNWRYIALLNNIRSQSICRALHFKIWSFGLNKFITDPNFMDFKKASLQFDLDMCTIFLHL